MSARKPETRITSTFQGHLDRSPPSKAPGVDIGAQQGTPVLACAPGRVVKAGWSNAGGWNVTLDHGGGLCSYYAHLFLLNVVAGQEAERGHILGWVGSTGRSTGPHLHFSVLARGRYVDPMEFLR